MSLDESPFTDAHRQLIQDRHRGRKVRPGWFRNFCSRVDCGVPLEVREEHRLIKTLRCPACAGSTDGKAAIEMLGVQTRPAISRQGNGHRGYVK